MRLGYERYPHRARVGLPDCRALNRARRSVGHTRRAGRCGPPDRRARGRRLSRRAAGASRIVRRADTLAAGRCPAAGPPRGRDRHGCCAHAGPRRAPRAGAELRRRASQRPTRTGTAPPSPGSWPARPASARAAGSFRSASPPERAGPPRRTHIAAAVDAAIAHGAAVINLSMVAMSPTDPERAAVARAVAAGVVVVGAVGNAASSTPDLPRVVSRGAVGRGGRRRRCHCRLLEPRLLGERARAGVRPIAFAGRRRGAVVRHVRRCAVRRGRRGRVARRRPDGNRLRAPGSDQKLVARGRGGRERHRRSGRRARLDRRSRVGSAGRHSVGKGVPRDGRRLEEVRETRPPRGPSKAEGRATARSGGEGATSDQRPTALTGRTRRAADRPRPRRRAARGRRASSGTARPRAVVTCRAGAATRAR